MLVEEVEALPLAVHGALSLGFNQAMDRTREHTLNPWRAWWRVRVTRISLKGHDHQTSDIVHTRVYTRTRSVILENLVGVKHERLLGVS